MGAIRLVAAAALVAPLAHAQPTPLDQSPQRALGTGQANTLVIYPISNVGTHTSITSSTAAGGIADFVFPGISIPTPGGATATGSVTGGLTRAGALRIVAQGLARASWVGVAFIVGANLYQQYGIAGDGAGGLTRLTGGTAPLPYDSSGWVNNGNYGGVHASMQAAIDAWIAQRNASQVGSPQNQYTGTCGMTAQSWGYLVHLTRVSDGSCQQNAMSVGPPDGTFNPASTACPGGATPINGMCGGTPTPTTIDGAVSAVPGAGAGGPTDAAVAAAAAAAAAGGYGPMTMRPGDITNPQMNVVPGGYSGPQTTASDILGNTTTTETDWDWISTNVGNTGQINLTLPGGTIGNIPYTWTGTHIHAGTGGTTHIGYGSSGMTHVPAVAGGWQSRTTTTTRNSSGQITSQTTETGTVSEANTAAPGTDPCTLDPSRIGCRSIGDPPTDLPLATTSPVVFAAEAVNLGSGCPAPHSVSIRGWSMNLNYTPACDVAGIVRFLVLACSAFGVAFFCVNTVNKT